MKSEFPADEVRDTEKTEKAIQEIAKEEVYEE